MRCLQTNSKKWAVTRILGLFLTVAATPLMMPAFFTQAIASDTDSDSDVDSDSSSDSSSARKRFTEDQLNTNVIETFKTASSQNETVMHKPIVLSTKRVRSTYHTGHGMLNLVNNFVSKTQEEFDKFEAARANFTSAETNIPAAEQYFALNIIKEYTEALVPVEILDIEKDKKKKRIYKETIAYHYAGLLNFFDVGTHILAYKEIVDAIEKNKKDKLETLEKKKATALSKLSLNHEKKIARKQKDLGKFKETGKGLKGASLKAFNESVAEKESEIQALTTEKERLIKEKSISFEAAEKEISNDFQLIPETFQDAFRAYGSGQWTSTGVFAVVTSTVRNKREQKINYGLIEEQITPEMLLSAQNRILSQILKAPTTLFTATVDEEDSTKKSSKKRSSAKKIQHRMVDLLKDEDTEEARKIYTLFYLLDVKPARLDDLAKNVALEIHEDLLKEKSAQTEKVKKVVKKEKSTSTSPSSGALSKLRKKKPGSSAAEDASVTSTSTSTSTTDSDEEDDVKEKKSKKTKVASVKDASVTSTSTSTSTTTSTDSDEEDESATETSASTEKATPPAAAASGTTLGGSTPTPVKKKGAAVTQTKAEKTE